MPGHFHRRAALAAHILTFSFQLDGVRLLVPLYDFHFALVFGQARPHLDADGAFEGAVIHGLGEFRAGDATDDLPRVAQQGPDLVDRLADIECLFNAYCHITKFLFPGESATPSTA